MIGLFLPHSQIQTSFLDDPRLKIFGCFNRSLPNVLVCHHSGGISLHFPQLLVLPLVTSLTIMNLLFPHSHTNSIFLRYPVLMVAGFLSRIFPNFWIAHHSLGLITLFI
jgi:hypothetical protein